MRLFLAADFRPPVFDAVLQARDVLKWRAGPGFQWSRAEQAHLTLRYLGEVPDGTVAPLTGAVARAVFPLAPFPLRISGYGAFPDPQHAKVAWLGMEEASPAGGLPGLLAALDASLQPFLSRREEKPFVAHLSLARHSGAGADLVQAFLGTAKPPASEHLLAGVCLFRSDRGPAGTRHTRLAEAPLEG